VSVLPGLVVVTDRGGHLSNARMFLDGLGAVPEAIVTTAGPELATLARAGAAVHVIPYMFFWLGKRRIWSLVGFARLVFVSARIALRLRPRWVISFGAADTVPFCYLSRALGARIFHVECMNQVVSPSVTGRLLYPIVTALFVQWEELRSRYGKKARYAGWVISA